jgi:hypothetical protein
MYNKAGPQTRLSQLRKTVREDKNPCIVLAQGDITYCCGCAAGCALA